MKVTIENECKCSCHRVEQIDHPVFGKMIYCSCRLPHGNPIECKMVMK